jgi:hypothetical protein
VALATDALAATEERGEAARRGAESERSSSSSQGGEFPIIQALDFAHSGERAGLGRLSASRIDGTWSGAWFPWRPAFDSLVACITDRWRDIPARCFRSRRLSLVIGAVIRSQAMSAMSTRPRNTWRKTCGRTWHELSSRAVVRVTRPSQYRSWSVCGFREHHAGEVNRALRSGVTGTPARCRRSPKAAQMAERSALATVTATQDRPSARARSWSSRYFRTELSVRSTLHPHPTGEGPSNVAACTQSMASATPGGF